MTSKQISKRGARSGSPPALHRLAGGNGPPCFPTFSKARAGRQHFCVLQENSGLVRSRAPLCIGPRGAIINHASRNFSKHARGVSIFEASQKFQSGGLVRSRPALCIGLRGAMAHHASRNFAKHARGVSIFEASKKIPSGGLVRSRHQLDEGLREAWSSILFGIYRMRNARSKFSLFLKLLDSQQFRITTATT